MLFEINYRKRIHKLNVIEANKSTAFSIFGKFDTGTIGW